MDWIKAIGDAVDYIETHLTEEISAEDVAKHVHMSPFYFQKGFGMLCGFTVMEYVRNRRLAVAACELAASGIKVIDAAFKYGYDSPDSFTKAFKKFHKLSPREVQRGGAVIKTFAPLKISVSLKGGFDMNYKIVEKESFKIVGAIRRFNYENCKEEIPKFWKEHFAAGNGKYICGMFGVNIDEKMGKSDFEYLIADVYDETKEIPKDFVVKTIPKFKWAVFSCDGPMPTALQDVNKKIFSEWLPALREYEFAAGYCIEAYDDASKYPNGTLDKNYHSEIWIPIKKAAEK